MNAAATRVITDQRPSYPSLKTFVQQRDSINHETEFVRGDVHTQNIENYWSLFKGGVYGVFHPTSARITCLAIGRSLTSVGTGGGLATPSGSPL